MISSYLFIYLVLLLSDLLLIIYNNFRPAYLWRNLTDNLLLKMWTMPTTFEYNMHKDIWIKYM